MKGAILSGGYGKRLYPYTKDIPKTMLELKQGFTILDLQFLDFKRNGINEVYMLVGYKKEEIEKRFGNSWKDIKIKYLEEEKPMGTLWAIKNLYEHDKSDFIIRNGDTICDADLRKLSENTTKNGKVIGILATKMVSPYGILGIKGSTIVEFKEKPILDYYINGGIYYFRKEISEVLGEDFQEKEIEKTVFPKLAREGKIYAYKHKGIWKSVDSIKDYEEAVKMFEKRRDYDFGYITDKNIMLYSGKDAELSGNFILNLIQGNAEINGKPMKKGKQYEVNGKVMIHSISQIYLSYGGKIENW